MDEKWSIVVKRHPDSISGGHTWYATGSKGGYLSGPHAFYGTFAERENAVKDAIEEIQAEKVLRTVKAVNENEWEYTYG